MKIAADNMCSIASYVTYPVLSKSQVTTTIPPPTTTTPITTTSSYNQGNSIF